MNKFIPPIFNIQIDSGEFFRAKTILTAIIPFVNNININKKYFRWLHFCGYENFIQEATHTFRHVFAVHFSGPNLLDYSSIEIPNLGAFLTRKH